MTGKKLRVVAMMLVFLLVFSLCACQPTQTTGDDNKQPETQASNATNQSAPAKEPASETNEEKPEISVAVLDFGNFPSDRGTLEDNDLTQWINENAPVKVKFIAVTRDEAITKFSTMMAADAAPDIIMEWDITAFEQFIVNGTLQPLDDAFEKCGQNLKATIPENVLQWGYYNGKLYGIPKIRSETNVVNWMSYIRQDWLDNLGLAMPTNMDEFYEVMRAFTFDDPDGNGVNDTWGFGAGFGVTSGLNEEFGGCDRITTLFGAQRFLWVPGEDGLLDYSDITKNKLEAVRFLEKMYDEGLCNPEFFTQTAQQSQSDWINGKYGTLGAQAGTVNATMLTAMLEVNPNANPVPLKTLTSPMGQYGYYKEQLFDLMMMVPTSCTNPEAVITYLDWMIQGPWERINYGIEGTHYIKQDGRIISIADTETTNHDLSHAAMYTLATAYNKKISDIQLELDYNKDTYSDIEKAAKLLQIASMEESLSQPFTFYTPTTQLGLEIVGEKLPSLTTFSKDTWERCIIDSDLGADEAYEMIKNEWKVLGYDEVRQAFNEKAKELGYID